MKRNIYQLVIATLVASMALLVAESCVKNVDGKSCKCCQSPVVEKSYNGKKLVFYNAFTPVNLSYCDSVDQPKELCRENPDSVFNDKVNEAFYVKGLDSFYNKVILRAKGDTTRIFNAVDYQRIGQSFIGNRNDTTLWGNPRKKSLTSGEYEYEVIIYSDKDHKMVLDTVKGPFCIIRNKTSCEVSGCSGMQEGDVLLK